MYKHYCLILISGLLLLACAKEDESNVHEDYYDPIIGLASPIQLERDTTLVNLEDYFLNVDEIDSIEWDLDYVWQKGQSELKLVSTLNGDVFVVKFWVKQRVFSILAKKTRKQNVLLKYRPIESNVKTVCLAGDINGWNATSFPFTKTDSIWTLRLSLNPGTYQYQIVVDGEWILDKMNKETVSNGIGGINSLLVVEKAKSENRIEFKDNAIYYNLMNENGHFSIWQNQLIEDISIDDRKLLSKQRRTFKRYYASKSNDLIVPIEYGKPIMSTSQLTRNDKHFNALYFVLVDRFYNGNKKNDEPIIDDRVHIKANYQGGDLAGIKEKLEAQYFDDLGFNSVWLSPITQNPLEAYQEFPEPKRYYSGYHGYWPISYKKVDHRFGSNKEFGELVDAAHKNDHNIILDFVSNHVHENHPMYELKNDWSTVLDLPDGRKNIRIWDEHRLTTWFDTFLPSLDFSRNEIIEAVSDSALFWLTEYNIDGYRHDATKHIPETFWRVLTKKIKAKYGSQIYQIGETFGSRELIGKYVNSGQQDAQFDFNLYFDARSVLIDEEQSFERLNSSLHETFDYYGWHSLMGNITGNHDMPRFISYAGKGLDFEEDFQKAGWERKVQVIDTIGYNKLSLLHAFVTTIPGIPIVYYGDEIGLAGAGDPDNRRMMKFDSLNRYQLRTKETLTKLMTIRNSNMALVYGDFHTVFVDRNVWIYERKYMDNKVTVCMNKSSLSQKIDTLKLLSKRFQFDNKIEDGKLTLLPYSFEIIIDN